MWKSTLTFLLLVLSLTNVEAREITHITFPQGSTAWQVWKSTKPRLLSWKMFRKETARLNGISNRDEAFRKLRPGIFPVPTPDLYVLKDPKIRVEIRGFEILPPVVTDALKDLRAKMIEKLAEEMRRSARELESLRTAARALKAQAKRALKQKSTPPPPRNNTKGPKHLALDIILFMGATTLLVYLFTRETEDQKVPGVLVIHDSTRYEPGNVEIGRDFLCTVLKGLREKVTRKSHKRKHRAIQVFSGLEMSSDQDEYLSQLQSRLPSLLVPGLDDTTTVIIEKDSMEVVNVINIAYAKEEKLSEARMHLVRKRA